MAIIAQKKRLLNVASLALILFLVAFPTICVSTTNASPNVQATTYYPWTMIGHDAAHTGFANGTPAPHSYISAWNATLSGASYFSDSVVSNGVLYVATSVTDTNGTVYAINATTGSVIWSSPYPTAFLTTPAVSENKVIVAGYNGMVYALNIANGAKIWNYSTGAAIMYSSPTIAEGKVFIGSGDKYFYALDINNGQYIWRKGMSYEVYTTPAVSDGKLYFATNYGYLYCYSTSNGAYQWSSSVNLSAPNSEIYTSPVVSGDKVFIGSYNYAKIFAFYKDSGVKAWEYSAGAPVNYAPAVAYGNVYVVTTTNHKVLALSQATGTLVWEYANMTYGSFVSPTIADGMVFVASNDYKLYALNATTGAYIWSFLAPNFLTSSPTVADGMVYVADYGMHLYAIGTPYVPAVGPTSFAIPMEYIIIGVIAVAAVAIIALMLMRRKPSTPPPPPPPKPAMLRLTPVQKEVFADGKSSVDINVELLDNKGIPIAADKNIEVSITAADGRIAPTVTIPKGSMMQKTTLISTAKVGMVAVTASARDLTGAQTTVYFTEKKRYCMICGQRMPVDAKACPNCGSVPPSGADTKVCPNCGSVIPIVAKFCKECGASQPL